VDFAGTGLLIGLDNADNTGGRQYCVAMSVGTGQVKVPEAGDHAKPLQGYLVTGSPVRYLPGSPADAVALFTFRPTEGGTSFQTVQYFQHGQAPFPFGSEVLRSGTQGVTAISQVEVAGTDLRITVSTSGGQQVWTYRKDPASGRWQKVGS
jgi:hypothetical protein